MRYCKLCLYPDSKPDLQIFSDGICSACKNFTNRAEVDWDERKKELVAILEKHRSKDSSRYDCIVPSSGGKDSTFQALKMWEFGMNPLIVTVTTDHLTDLGRRNIENLKNQGFDTIEVTPNPVLRRKINKLALETLGDISWPEHLLIFTVPVRIAVQMNVPLIVWGECSQNEYGGPATATQSSILNRRWLEEFGGLLGMRVSDLPDLLRCYPKELIQYQYPSDEDLQRVGVTGIFLGYFVPWSGAGNAEYSKKHGFETYDKCVEGSAVDYENLDNGQCGLHDYFKWLKYGFGRASDLVSMAIRRGTMTREQGLRLVEERDGAYPESYLGVPLGRILEEIGMTRKEFDACCDRFRNRKIHAH